MSYPFTLADLRNDVLNRLGQAANSYAPALEDGTGTASFTTTAKDVLNQFINERQEDLCRTCYSLKDTGTVTVALNAALLAFNDLTVTSGKRLWGADGVSVQAVLTVTAASNASPIVLTTAVAHGLSTGATVTVAGVTGNTAANGSWTITSVSSTTFSLLGSTGNGSYVSGGTATVNTATALRFCGEGALRTNYPSWTTDAAGAPAYFYRQGETGVGFYPSAYTAHIFTVKGQAVPARLSADGDIPTWLLPDLERLLVAGAAFDVAEKSQQNDDLKSRAPIWQGEYEGGKAALLSRLWQMDPVTARAHYSPPPK